MMKLLAETDPTLNFPVEEEFDFYKSDIDPGVLSREMFETMIVNNGIGLAAPQIGLRYRVFVMIMNSYNSSKPTACFNPKIITYSENCHKAEEGCLSFPNLYLKVSRSASITAEWQNEFGELKSLNLYGIEARCFQHELDHLNGITFISKVGKTSLILARSKRKTLSRRSNT